MLTNHVPNAGTVAHYHMDPGTHDDRTINLLLTLIDAMLKDEDLEITEAVDG